MIQRFLATKPEHSFIATAYLLNMAGIEQGDVSNEEFMEEVARYECVYNRNSKGFKDKNKKANCWEIIGEKFDLSTAEAEDIWSDWKSTLCRKHKVLWPKCGRPQVLGYSKISWEPKTDVFDGFKANVDVA